MARLDWRIELHALFLKVRTRGHYSVLKEHPQYPHWISVLETLSEQHGVTDVIVPGRTIGACERLVAAGADPEQILAVATLLFG
jgi:hypothetical protein